MDKTNLKGIDLFEKALKLFADKKTEKAREIFQKVLDEKDVPITLKNRCEVFLKKCDSILNPVKNKAKTFEDFLDFATYYLNLDQLDKAKEYLKKAEKMNKDHHLIPYLYAILSVKEGHFEKGVDFLKKSIELNEKNKIFAKNDPDFGALENYKPFMDLVEAEEEE